MDEHGGTAHYRGANRAPASAQVTLDIDIAAEDLGRVIGRHGAYLKQIRERTGCSVDVSQGDWPIVTLRGPQQNVDTARHMVLDVAASRKSCFIRDLNETALLAVTADGWLREEAVSIGPTTFLGYLMRSSSFVPLYNGAEKAANSAFKVSFKKTDFPMSFQAAANVVADVKQRSLRISGNDDTAAANFREVVLRRIAEMTKPTEMRLEGVPLDALQTIRELPTIRQLQNIHFLKISIVKEANSSIVMILGGPRVTVAEAAATAQGILTPSGSRCVIPIWQRLFEDVPQKKWEDFRTDITEAVEQEFNVAVDLNNSVQITITGNDIDTVEDARRETEARKDFRSHLVQSVRMQSVDLRISVDRGRIWLCGSSRAAERAYRKLTAEVAEWRVHNVVIPLAHKRLAGVVTGPRGDAIRRIQNSTGAAVSVLTTPDGEQAVHIYGSTAERAQRAKAAVESLLVMAGGGQRRGATYKFTTEVIK